MSILNPPKYYKLTNESGIHNGFEFKEGWNVDHQKWNTHPCSAGGIYITEFDCIGIHLVYSADVGAMIYIWDAEIPGRTPWNNEGNKIKAHQVILSNKRKLVDEPWWNTMFRQALRYSRLDRITSEIRDSRFIYFLESYTDNISRLAIAECTGLLGLFHGNYIRDADDFLIEAALLKFPEDIRFLRDEDLHRNPKFFLNAFQEARMLNLNRDGFNFEFFQHRPSFLQNASLEVQKVAVRFSADNIAQIDKPNLELMLIAVHGNGDAIRFIETPPEEVQLKALQHNGYALRYIKNPSFEICMAAVTQNGHAIEHVPKAIYSDSILLAAIHQNPRVSRTFQPSNFS